MGKKTVTATHDFGNKIKIDYNTLTPEQAYTFAHAFLMLGAIETAFNIVKPYVTDRAQQTHTIARQSFYGMACIYLACKDNTDANAAQNIFEIHKKQSCKHIVFLLNKDHKKQQNNIKIRSPWLSIQTASGGVNKQARL